MKHRLRHACAMVAAAIVLLSRPLNAADTSPGSVDFGRFTKPTNGELVEIQLNSDTIAMALQIAGQIQPELATALTGLHTVRVNVIGLDDQNRDEIVSRMKSVRSQLDAAGWRRLVSVQDKREDVGIFLRSRGQEAIEGVVVTVVDRRKEAVFINVAGDIRMDKLVALAGKFNLDALKQAVDTITKEVAAPQKPAPKN